MFCSLLTKYNQHRLECALSVFHLDREGNGSYVVHVATGDEKRSHLSSVQNPFSEPFSDHCSSTQLPRRMKWTKKFTDVTERSDANRKIDPFESRLFPSPPEAPIQVPYQHCENASPPTLQLTNR